jgi:hypothetical protein
MLQSLKMEKNVTRLNVVGPMRRILPGGINSFIRLFPSSALTAGAKKKFLQERVAKPSLELPAQGKHHFVEIFMLIDCITLLLR